MNNNKIFMVICFFISIPFTLISQKNNVESSVTNCGRKFFSLKEDREKIIDLIKADPTMYGKSLGKNYTVYDYLKDGICLSNNQDSIAKNYMIIFFNNLYDELNKDSAKILLSNTYIRILPMTINKMPISKEVFEVALKFASVSDTYVEGHGHIEHYGLTFMNELFNMVDADQVFKYYLMKAKLSNEYQGIDNELQLINIHTKLYSAFKQDWKAGKIKLKSTKSAQIKK